MFNYNADVFVILYPYCAGGKFLQMVMHLDPDAPSLNHNPKPTYDQVLEYVKTNNNAHVAENQVIPDDIKSMRAEPKYIFQFHEEIVEWEDITEIMRKCTRLKPIFISCSTEADRRLLNRRRFEYTPQNMPLMATPSERVFSKLLPRFVSLWWNATPALTINLSDYWDPDKAKPILRKFFAENNISSPGWEELYDAWHAKSIAPSIL